MSVYVHMCVYTCMEVLASRCHHQSGRGSHCCKGCELWRVALTLRWHQSRRRRKHKWQGEWQMRGCKRQIERESCTQPTHTQTHGFNPVKRSARNKGCHVQFEQHCSPSQLCVPHFCGSFSQMLQVLECNVFFLPPAKQTNWGCPTSTAAPALLRVKLTDGQLHELTFRADTPW